MIHLNIRELEFSHDVLSSHIEVQEIVNRCISTHHKGYLIALNPEKIVNTARRRDWKQIWAKSLGNYVDGIGIYYALKILTGASTERVFLLDLVLNQLQENHGSIFLFGAKEDVVGKAKDAIQQKYPSIDVRGAIPGYGFKDEDIISKINDAKPDVVVVALGSPIQEEWIYKNISHVNQGVFIGVGGGLDVLSGEVRRAPVFFQKLGLEWFYRLITQPTRIHRQLKLGKFIWAVMKEKFSSQQKTVGS